MGFRLSKLYTRTGDEGKTGLADGRRIEVNWRYRDTTSLESQT